MPRPKKAIQSNHGGRTAILLVVALATGLGAILYLAQGTQGNNATNVSSAPQEAISQPKAEPVIIPEFAILGSKNAPVTIVEYGEFQCPSCGYWVKSTQEERIVKRLVDTGKAKLVWRDFAYYGPDSAYAAEAAYAAGEQGKFWEFYGILFSKQGNPNDGWASKDNLRKYAQTLGLDMTKFDNVLESRKYLPVIKSNFDSGRELGVDGTPTFFLIGPTGKSIKIVGAQPYEVFERAINSLIGG